MICPSNLLKIDGFIGQWLSQTITVNSVALPLTFCLLVCFFSLLHTNMHYTETSDSSLTFSAQCLEKEVQEVKSTLQRMLTQLQVEEQQEDDTDVSDELVKGETRVKVKAEEEEDEEEEEDQYFSDSWDIWDRRL